MAYISRTDWENERIVYSQYFPEKWLSGDYEFKVSTYKILANTKLLLIFSALRLSREVSPIQFIYVTII